MISAKQLADEYMRRHSGNTYTYVKIKNLLKGDKGSFTKQEIRSVRQILKEYLTTTDKALKQLEK